MSLNNFGEWFKNHSISRRNLSIWGVRGFFAVAIIALLSDRETEEDIKGEIEKIENKMGHAYKGMLQYKLRELGNNIVSKELEEKIIGSLYRVYVRSSGKTPGRGTGYFIRPNVMITAGHVADTKVLGIYGNDDSFQNQPPKHIYLDKKNDLAFFIFDESVQQENYFQINKPLLSQGGEDIVQGAIGVGYGGPINEIDVIMSTVIPALNASPDFEVDNIINEERRALIRPVRAGTSGGLVVSILPENYGTPLGVITHTHGNFATQYEPIEDIQEAFARCKEKYGNDIR